MSAYFLFEVRDSDGNDVSVTDVIVEASGPEAASQVLWAYLEECYPDDETDGGWGTFHACDCACDHQAAGVCDACADTWECEHGGLVTDEDDGGPLEFPTLAEARKAHASYHDLKELIPSCSAHEERSCS